VRKIAKMILLTGRRRWLACRACDDELAPGARAGDTLADEVCLASYGTFAEAEADGWLYSADPELCPPDEPSVLLCPGHVPKRTLDELRAAYGLKKGEPLGVVHDHIKFAGWRGGDKLWTLTKHAPSRAAVALAGRCAEWDFGADPLADVAAAYRAIADNTGYDHPYQRSAADAAGAAAAAFFRLFRDGVDPAEAFEAVRLAMPEVLAEMDRRCRG
jgi:hypothetical protein